MVAAARLGRAERYLVEVQVFLSAPQECRKGENNMNNLEIILLENRIHLLTQRDPVGNAKIIKKLERRLRASRKCIRGLRAKIAYID